MVSISWRKSVLSLPVAVAVFMGKKYKSHLMMEEVGNFLARGKNCTVREINFIQLLKTFY